MHAKAAFPALFFTASGCVLFLLVTLSVPVFNHWALLEIKSSLGATVRLGVFGACYTARNSPATCSSAHVGYGLDATYFGNEVSSRFGNVVARGLSGSLVLNPIAAGLAGINMVFAFCAWWFASRISEIVTFFVLFLSALAGWLAFWLDLALVLIARHKVTDHATGAQVISGHIGKAVWFALGGIIALTLAICAAGIGSFGRYSGKRDYGYGGRGTY